MEWRKLEVSIVTAETVTRLTFAPSLTLGSSFSAGRLKLLGTVSAPLGSSLMSFTSGRGGLSSGGWSGRYPWGDGGGRGTRGGREEQGVVGWGVLGLPSLVVVADVVAADEQSYLHLVYY